MVGGEVVMRCEARKVVYSVFANSFGGVNKRTAVIGWKCRSRYGSIIQNQRLKKNGGHLVDVMMKRR